MNLSYIDTRYAAFFRFVGAVIVCLFLFSCPVSAGISLHMANNIDLSSIDPSSFTSDDSTNFEDNPTPQFSAIPLGSIFSNMFVK